MSIVPYINRPAPFAWDVAAAIFGASGLEGGLYDPSDLSTLFQTSTGTVPALPGDPVGLVLDAREEMGPELVTKPIDLTQSPYESAGSTLSGNTFTTNSPVAGVLWDGKLDLTSREVTVRYSGLTDGIFGIYDVIGSRPVATSTAASGVVRAIYKPAGGSDSGRIYLRCANSGQTITIEDFSVREVLNPPLSQPTAAARPTLARIPLTGRRNLLTNSAFIGAVSGSPGTDPVGWGFAGTGGTTSVEVIPNKEGNKVTFSSEGLRRGYSHPFNFQANTTYTLSAVVDVQGTPTAIHQYAAVRNISGVTLEYLVDGTVLGGSSPMPLGEHLLEMRITTTVEGSGHVQLGVGLQTNAVDSSITVQEPQLEIGIERTDYQLTRNAFDVTEAGVPDTYSLVYDLTDDDLTTTFPSTVTGDILIAGRNGSIIEPFSGNTLTIGPTSYTGGTPGILSAIGGIVGVLVIDRSLTQVEKDQLIAYYKGKGAGDLL